MTNTTLSDLIEEYALKNIKKPLFKYTLNRFHSDIFNNQPQRTVHRNEFLFFSSKLLIDYLQFLFTFNFFLYQMSLVHNIMFVTSTKSTWLLSFTQFTLQIRKKNKLYLLHVHAEIYLYIQFMYSLIYTIYNTYIRRKKLTRLYTYDVSAFSRSSP